MKYLTSGIDPYEIKSRIDKDVKIVTSYIKDIKQDVDLNKIKEIATISANNDSEIGELLANAYEKIGKDGVITIEENKGSDTYIKIVEGTKIERGFASPYFINNSEEQTCELINPFIYSHKGNLSNIKDILQLLENVSKNRDSLLILTESIEPEILEALVLNKIQNHLKVCVVKVPFEQLMEQRRADKVIVTSSSTTIIAPDMGAQVAVIYVGASTEVELLEKKDRVEDAICAVRAAIEEGIVPGGGYTYLEASLLLEQGIIQNALRKPAEQIANNAGKCGELVVEQSLETGKGFDAKECKFFEDLTSQGIIDPAKVTRVALENAASIASMFLLTECVIHNA
jgi:chaperonin GroEL